MQAPSSSQPAHEPTPAKPTERLPIVVRLRALALAQRASRGDHDTRRAQAVSAVALLCGIGALIYLAAAALVPTSRANLVGAAIAFVIFATTWALARSGRLRVAGWVAYLGTFSLMGALVALSGWSSVVAGSFLTMLVVAGAMLPVSGLLVAGVLTLAAVATGHISAAIGWIPTRGHELGSDLVLRTLQVITIATLIAWNQRAHQRLVDGLRSRKAELRASNQALEESRRAAAQLVDESPDGVIIASQNGVIQLANPAFERITGHAVARVEGQSFQDIGFLTGASLPQLLGAFAEVLAGKDVPPFELEVAHPSGAVIPVEVHGRLLRRPDGKTVVQAIIRDIRDRKRAEKVRADLEADLRQAQRVDALGRLAGGIAHDFNNLLTVIITNATLLRERALPADAVEDIDAIESSGKKAAELTRQLLAFSRKQVLQPRVLDLSEIVEGTHRMLRRLLPEEIGIVLRRSPEPLRIKADRGQIEQVVVNLAVNARDAMPHGGTLSITTGERSIEIPTRSERPALPPGRYAVLTVSDNGSGMDEATRERIFEPFFTTKPLGQGTGLGLATVNGIVSQSGGTIRVKSQSGLGSTFEILLPLTAEEPATPPPEAKTPPPELRGSDTILLVEDDKEVRQTAHKILRGLGYNVLVAADANDALAIALGSAATIDLLLTDVVMPGASGPDLAARLRSHFPLRVLFMSGHADDAIRRTGVLDQSGASAASEPDCSPVPESSAFLQKPFTSVELAQRVRAVLDSAPG